MLAAGDLKLRDFRGDAGYWRDFHQLLDLSCRQRTIKILKLTQDTSERTDTASMLNTNARMHGEVALKSLANKFAVEVKARFIFLIDHGNVGPGGQRHGINERRGEVTFSLFEDAEAITAHGEAGACLIGRGINVLPGGRIERIVANRMFTVDAGRAFVGKINFHFGSGPDRYGEIGGAVIVGSGRVG